MANIQSIISEKYGIDVSQENIFKLYKIDKADISDEDLEIKIVETRKRWQQSINGANERNAERDRRRLNNAIKYEDILRDKVLRKSLDEFYNGEKAPKESFDAPVGIQFAREFFSVISTSKKVGKSDVEFFFSYFSKERKNKKPILEMLAKDFKIFVQGKENDNIDDNEEVEGKKKKDSSPLIVNKFQEATVLKVQRCKELLDTVEQESEVVAKYPLVKQGLFEFLQVQNIETAEQFSADLAEKSKETYSVRQEKGAAFIPLVDLYNIMKELAEYQDVVDNFKEFKLLLKYPLLTPYMYVLSEFKQSTLKKFEEVANRNYIFRDETDFLLNYFIPIYDNFAISCTGIGNILRKAKKKAKANQFLNSIDEKLGREKRRKVSLGARFVHLAVYFPIFLIYFVFEICKYIFTSLKKFAIPMAIIIFVGTNWLLPRIANIENLLFLKNLLNRSAWIEWIESFVGMEMSNPFQTITMSLAVIIGFVGIYALPAYIAYSFVSNLAILLSEVFDWIGIERTFQNIMSIVRSKTEDQYIKNRKLFYKKKVPQIIINGVCVSLIALIVYLLPIGFSAFSEATGYFQTSNIGNEIFIETEIETENSEMTEKADTLEEVGPLMIITVQSANIREGVGTKYGVMKVAHEGDVFVSTGAKQEASNGTIWYEIYVDEEKSMTGWASGKVIEYKE